MTTIVKVILILLAVAACANDEISPASGTGLRIVSYERYEFHQDSADRRQGSLAEFVLDVPYLVQSGVIPPLHVLNAVTQTGGGDAGMSPGAGWEPFQVTQEEYDALVTELRRADLRKLRREDRARFVPDTIIVDETLHGASSHVDWIRKVSQKYRNR